MSLVSKNAILSRAENMALAMGEEAMTSVSKELATLSAPWRPCSWPCMNMPVLSASAVPYSLTPASVPCDKDRFF